MLAVRCVKAEIHAPTQHKRRQLRLLFKIWREMVRTKSTYSDLRTRFPSLDSRYARVASFKAKTPREPIYLPKDLYRLMQTKNKFAKYFLGIPIEVRHWIWLPLRMSQHDIDLLSAKETENLDSQMLISNGRFFVRLMVRHEGPLMKAQNLLAVDLGERILATAVLWRGSQASIPRWFYGKEVRGIRRHHAWLRKRLGERKLVKKIKFLGNKEQRQVNGALHKISRQIVDTAKEHQAAIILGDLEGIRKRARGKRMNRIVGNMAYFRLSEYIKYKAAWAGIPVLTTSEAYTSRECPRCHNNGQRPHRGLFKCPYCEYSANADYVGARNLAERASRWLEAGALRVQAQNGDMTNVESPEGMFADSKLPEPRPT